MGLTKHRFPTPSHTPHSASGNDPCGLLSTAPLVGMHLTCKAAAKKPARQISPIQNGRASSGRWTHGRALISWSICVRYTNPKRKRGPTIYLAYASGCCDDSMLFLFNLFLRDLQGRAAERTYESRGERDCFKNL